MSRVVSYRCDLCEKVKENVKGIIRKGKGVQLVEPEETHDMHICVDCRKAVGIVPTAAE